MGFSLWNFQETLKQEIKQLMLQGCRRILVQSATGSGKTVLASDILGSASAKNFDSWFIVHRRELIRQSSLTLTEGGVRHGIQANTFPEDPSALVQIANIGSLARRYKRLRKPKLIGWDEAHHIAAKSWDKIYREFPDAFHIGFTATPERTDGTGLDKWFDKMVNGPSVEWLIENGFLCKYKMYAPGSLDLSGVHTRMGDYVKSELASIVNKPTITGDAIREYKKHCAGMRAIAFCISIDHSKDVVAQFIDSGVKAEHVDGETPSHERDQAIERFKRGEISVLSNVDLFGEGFDVPATQAGILLRPTQSEGLYLQQVGRTLRRGKDYAVLLDHAGNAERHGLPDEDRAWSLTGREKNKKRDTAIRVRNCPSCFAVQPPGQPSCIFCGYAFTPEPREVDRREGDLFELDAQEIKRRRRYERLTEQSDCKTHEELVALAKMRKHKKPEKWASHILVAREEKRKNKQAQKLERGRRQ